MRHVQCRTEHRKRTSDPHSDGGREWISAGSLREEEEEEEGGQAGAARNQVALGSRGCRADREHLTSPWR